MDDLENAPTHWVFGYGSLIWNPGFAHVSAQQGLLRGAHRSLSIVSHHHRGTVEQPGLVFGLTRGGSCRGMVFEVADAEVEEARAKIAAAMETVVKLSVPLVVTSGAGPTWDAAH